MQTYKRLPPRPTRPYLPQSIYCPPPVRLTIRRKRHPMNQVRIVIRPFNARRSTFGQQKPLALAAVGYSDGLRAFIHSGDGEIHVVGNEAKVDDILSDHSKSSDKEEWEPGIDNIHLR